MNTPAGLKPPSTGRERLATELRRLRDLTGVSGRDLAQRVGISQSKVSRIETGAVVPSLPEVTAWGKELGASIETLGRLAAMTEAAYNELRPWRSALRRGHPQESTQDQESTAARILVFEPSVVPALLQTAEYAHHVIPMLHETYPDTDPAAEITSQLHRQLALYDSHRHFKFLITEAALRWRPGSTQSQLAQLDRVSSISTLDNVTIGLIPLSVEATTLTTHGFALYESEGKGSWITVETIHAEMTVVAPEHLQTYRSPLVPSLRDGTVRQRRTGIPDQDGPRITLGFSCRVRRSSASKGRSREVHRVGMRIPCDHAQITLERVTAQRASELRRRDVMPQLGILVCSEGATSFLTEVTDAAHMVGVDIRCLNLTSHEPDDRQLPEHLQRQFDTLAPTWAWNDSPDRFAAGLHAALNYQIETEPEQAQSLPGHSQPPRGYHSPDTTCGSPLDEWTHQQRIDIVASALRALTEDDSVHGVICAPPLPQDLSLRVDIAPYIPAAKDVAGARPDSLSALLPFPGLSGHDLVLTKLATEAAAPNAVRRLSCTLLALATVYAAHHQNPPTHRTEGITPT